MAEAGVFRRTPDHVDPDAGARLSGELFSAYYVSAYDEAYTIFQGPSPQMDEYLVYIKGLSEVDSDVELDGEAKYVMLSTCAYVFTFSRAIINGKMVPIDSAGGSFSPLD